MPLPAGSLKSFFALELPPRAISTSTGISSARLSKLRRGHMMPTAADIAAFSIAFGEPYDTVVSAFKAAAMRRLRVVSAEASVTAEANP